MLKMPDSHTPLLVLRSVAHSGLAIVRSLGSWGVPVYSLESDRLSPSFYSRYSRGHFLWNLQKRPASQSLEHLIEIARKIGPGAVLLPTRDQAAIFIAEHAEALAPWFVFSRQPADLVHSLCNKRTMYGLARQSGVPVPNTLFPQSRDEVLEFVTRSSFPILVKAVDGDRMVERVGRRMFVVRSAEDLIRIYDRIGDPENVMLQDYIPGPEENCWIFHGYFNRRSECLAAFTGRKLRQCRAYGGDTCLGIAATNHAIHNQVADFLQAIGYSGLVDVCIRYDARDRLYKVLDVNPRIGANARIFVSDGGLDLARIYYADITGQDCRVEPVPDGRKWLVEDSDLVSSVRYWLDGNLSVRSWLSSFRGIKELAYLQAGDLLPVVARLAADVMDAGRRLNGKGGAADVANEPKRSSFSERSLSLTK